jgi:hypothetical protein
VERVEAAEVMVERQLSGGVLEQSLVHFDHPDRIPLRTDGPGGGRAGGGGGAAARSTQAA